MAGYPTFQLGYQQGKKDPKTGGSITITPRTEPDFGKFTKEHWEAYNKEKLTKENGRLKGILAVVGLIVFYYLISHFGGHSGF